MPSVTITFSAAHAVRIQDALEEVFEMDRAATVDDLKNYIVKDLKQFVRTSERRVARKTADEAISDVDLT